ncbi:radical SAM protein [Neolewinella litorea]|uniref:Radical SAM protein n=1 Tax=Neolewinella litorea TaxID=2562452 RepID=A0A4S4NLS8_9BACT|nr:radical SAM protein [Neolewinella litorea]
MSTFAPAPGAPGRSARLWKPRHIYFTAAAHAEEHGRRIADRLDQLRLPYEVLSANRLPKLGGSTVRETYQKAKNTLAIVTAPPSALKLTPIPPSADWQFHLAKGCPAHCQYCYLAGSLPGAPVTRTYANLEAILENNANYIDPHRALTTFEASCYTDPLGIEHLTGSLSRAIEWFGQQPEARLRWVTKYDAVNPLLNLQHNGQTRCRISLNAGWVTRRLEGGTADLEARLHAMRRLAQAGYRVGAVLAPLMPFEDWKTEYADMLDRLREALDFPVDLTFELITHRFTPGSKEILLDWYPNTSLDFNEETRAKKRNKFGSHKFVYTREQMDELKGWFSAEIKARFPEGEVLYFT